MKERIIHKISTGAQ